MLPSFYPTIGRKTTLRWTSVNTDGDRWTCRIARGACSISDPQEILPLAKVALEAHALGDSEV
jgi:hypothetical protein